MAKWAKQELKKADLPNDLILRGKGRWQGGRSVMVSTPVSYQGEGPFRFAPDVAKINASDYIERVDA